MQYATEAFCEEVDMNPKFNEIYLSKIFDWYRVFNLLTFLYQKKKDFGENDSQLLTFIEKHLKGKKKELLKEKIIFVEYNWQPNTNEVS